MDKKTIQDIEEALEKVKAKKPTLQTLSMYVMLNQAKDYMQKESNEKFSEEDAEKWVKHMAPSARWTKDQTTTAMQQRGYRDDPAEFYAVMNAMASDYGKTMAKYGADKPEVYADLAHEWLNDADAKEDKAAAYFRNIVKH